eukprot:3764556-Prymnesium_polylepis.1
MVTLRQVMLTRVAVALFCLESVAGEALSPAMRRFRDGSRVGHVRSRRSSIAPASVGCAGRPGAFAKRRVSHLAVRETAGNVEVDRGMTLLFKPQASTLPFVRRHVGNRERDYD